MSIEMTVHQVDSYLHFRVTGINSPENVRHYFSQVQEFCAQQQCPFVLIEENLQGPGLKLSDIYQLVAEGSQRVFPHVRRLAYVDTNPLHSSSDMQFAENVAVNRGLNMRVFARVEDAEQWITAEAARVRSGG